MITKASQRRGPAAPSRMTYDVVRTPDALAHLLIEWLELYHRTRCPNPFAHPIWVATWLKHYAAPKELYVVTVRQDERLVAVAPFYRRRRSRLMPGVCLELAGANSVEPLTEIPEILIESDSARRTLRGLMHFLFEDCADDWDWVTVSLGPTQGWFEPEWIPAWAQARGSSSLYRDARAFVTLDLPPTWKLLRSTLKRNMKEAIRRSSNRLAHAAGGWEYARSADDDVPAGIDTLLALHRSRATVTQHKQHADGFTDAADEAFLREVVAAMVAAGCATVGFLRIGGIEVAGRLMLHTNGSTFFSISGLDPAYWTLGPGTALMTEGLSAAIDRGDRVANLSQHPEDSKLRWSEQLEVHHQFLFAAPRRSARIKAGLFVQLRALRAAYGLLRKP